MSRHCVLSWGAVFTAAMFWAEGAAADFESATVFVREVVVKTGKTQIVDINVEVKPGYHVQANPASFDNLIPLTLTLWPTSGVTAGSPIYPAAKKIHLEESGTELRVYDGKFTVKIPITVNAVSPDGGWRLKGTLRYQACDHQRCLAPRSRQFNLAVRIKAAEASSQKQ